jgi:predicted nuclease of predicted toxin-antitoxin system
MKEMADNSVAITVAKVLRNAGITTQRVNHEVLSYIKKMINEYNHGNIIIIENNDL